jgi:AraC family transcriptional regulator of adaptative response/methylated-DNA-[protein]-cysteine methyltransferase
MTYGEVALTIGRPGAARAVGQAVGANPLAVVIPCHRVVSKGKLTGYRWGLDRKRELLAWELLRRDPLEMPF